MVLIRPTLPLSPLIGWREDVCLPDFGAGVLIAKIDTGAKMAALHASDIHVIGKYVQFTLEMAGKRRHCGAALHGMKKIKSSNGYSELRPIIETVVEVGEHRFLTEITLTNRSDMGVPMLLGREALKHRFLVHPGRSFILSRRKKKLK